MSPTVPVRNWAAVLAAVAVLFFGSSQPTSAQTTTSDDQSISLKQPRRTAVRLTSYQDTGDAEDISPGAIDPPDDIEIVFPDDGIPSGTVDFDFPSDNMPQYWASGEYLLWWARGMQVPPLVTTSPSGTPANDVGVLGRPGTQILYGNGRILTDDTSGFRGRLGMWFDEPKDYGVGGEYLRMFTEREHFEASSDSNGEPSLARPFFNINPRDATGTPAPPAREDAGIVSLVNVARGRVMVSYFARRRDRLVVAGFQ